MVVCLSKGDAKLERLVWSFSCRIWIQTGVSYNAIQDWIVENTANDIGTDPVVSFYFACFNLSCFGVIPRHFLYCLIK